MNIFVKILLLLAVNAYFLTAAYRSYKNKRTWVPLQIFAYTPENFEVKGSKVYVFIAVYLVIDVVLSFLLLIA